MTPNPCPTDETLAQLALGALPEAERAPISDHLARCESCRDRAATLPAAAEISKRPTVELSSTSAPLDRGTLVGRYVILQLLGSGAMGFVYEAVDPELERKVALKLLRTSRRTDEGRARLLREAQAMARLSHPNVVPIFDVGTTDSGDVFLAMERVEGQTLTEWCKAQQDWRQILRYFLYAGRGLAAAHAAGLVHRDFKPHNVLVGKDGRVRVTDFGLVRLVSDSEPSSASTELERSAPLGTPLTRDGVLVGTPQYMSPEQLSGEKVDARGDQFSFCVALYQALYRELPFPGERLHEVLAQQLVNQVREPPAGSRVPHWVRKALLRGMRSTPGERFPTMEALFAALERDPSRAWRRAGIAAAVALLVTGLGALEVWRLRAPGPCAGAAEPIAEAWNASTRAALSAAYRAIGKPFAAETSREVDAELSGYGRRWSELARSTCEAALVRRQVPEDAYARQRECLLERQRELSAFVGLLARSDAATLANGVGAVQALAPVDGCAKADASTVRRSAEEAMHPAELEGLRKGLAEADAQNALGHFREAAAAAERALTGAPHLRQTSLASSLLYQQGFAQYSGGDSAAAAKAYEQAALISEGVGNDSLAAAIWIGRGSAATRLAQYEEASLDLSFAKAKLSRLPAAPDSDQIRWLNAMSALAYEQGKYADAADGLRRALADSRLSWTPLEEAATREQLGTAELRMAHNDAAAEQYERAISLAERELGKSHPELAGLYAELGVIRHRQKRDPEARALYQRAIALDDEAYGKGSLESASWLNNLAVLESEAGHSEAALELLHRVLEIKERAEGADHPAVATSLVNEATAYIELKRFRPAEDDLARAAKILIARKGQDHPDLFAVYTDLGAAQSGDGDYALADASFEKALAVARARLRPNHPWLGDLWTQRGDNDLKRRRWSSASSDYQTALGIEAANKADPSDQASARYGLAQALAKQGRDRARAVALAREALRAVEASPQAEGPSAEEIRRWLRTHGGTGPER